MASAFAHAAAGAALWPLFRTPRAPRFGWALGAALAVLPDVDVVGFRMGIAYGDLLGHRGLTHSLLVALAVGGAAGWMLSRGMPTRDRASLAAYLVVAMASHGILDAMTTGGLGVALAAPLDDTRYFFPWRPIEVSPISVTRFFSARGLRVLESELVVVWLPALALAALGWLVRRRLRLEAPGS